MAESHGDETHGDLVAYLDGELEPSAARTLELRLKSDAALRAELDSLKRTWRLLDHLPRPVPSSTSTRRTLTRLSGQIPALTSGIAGRPARGRRLEAAWVVAWAAAVLLAGTIGFFGGRLLSQRPAAQADAPPGVRDEDIVRDLRLLENRALYEKAGDVGFLRGLSEPNDPDLFGGPSGD